MVENFDATEEASPTSLDEKLLLEQQEDKLLLEQRLRDSFPEKGEKGKADTMNLAQRTKFFMRWLHSNEIVAGAYAGMTMKMERSELDSGMKPWAEFMEKEMNAKALDQAEAKGWAKRW